MISPSWPISWISSLWSGAQGIHDVREALERLEVCQGWQGKPFSCKDVNARLFNAEYLDLMHQQW
ncbi:hypothetical protein BB934_30425 (plasmid) [Microvirga ossetica]|uniref:Uncharacterized protein n=1 Tax=Microvirga ossetica TaxID=1882682 RepID=A0A1B2ERJ0_9HYPH|nr:hypothetical protein BB934_30425 [Microvirga ossetica]